MSFVRNLCVLVGLGLMVTPLLAQEAPAKSDACVIKMVLGTGENEEAVMLWVSDGAKYAYVSAIMHAIEDGTIEENLTLHVEPTDAPIDPTKISNERQMNIRITENAAELFVSEKMPFHILESVNTGLKETFAMQRIVLRAVKMKSAPNDSDPFGAGNSTAKANKSSDATKARGSDAPGKAPKSSAGDDPFGN